MKRKIFSKLLMGALVIASVSAFVSCKDYDDDINNLQKQIDAKAATEQIANLQSQLASALSAAQAAQTTADKAVADAAAAAKTAGNAATASALDAAKKEVSDVATAAGEQAAKAIADAAAAQSAADAAAAAAKAAQEAADKAAAAAADDTAVKAAAEVAATAKAAADKAAADAKSAQEAAAEVAKEAKAAAEKAVADASKEIASKLAGYYTKEEITALLAKYQAAGDYATTKALNDSISSLSAKIQAVAAAAGDTSALEALTKTVGNYQSAIDQLYSIVTSVELVGSMSAGAVPGNQKWINGGGYVLNFYSGKQATKESFGDNEDKYSKADKVLTYDPANDIRTNRAILIRVNPVNATFTKDQVQLIDSKGNDLSKIVKIGDPVRYDGLITRAGSQTGLWVLPLSVMDDVKKDDFNTVTFDVQGEKVDVDADPQILYAVSIKNDTTTNDRFVASTFDIRAKYIDYVPANDFNFWVKIGNVWTYSGNIHNRWEMMWDNNDGLIKFGIQGEDGANKSFDNPELAWALPGVPGAKASEKPTILATGGVIKDPTVWNYTADNKSFDDRRRGWASLEVEPGKPFVVSLKRDFADQLTAGEVVRHNPNKAGTKWYNQDPTEAEAYYVTLDLGNAIESDPSESNAWNTYNIEGVNKLVSADEDLRMLIPEESSAAGDYIGFRVYVVNYDGTLADPDGKAFYVHVKGEPVSEDALTVNVTVTKVNDGNYDTYTNPYDFSKSSNVGVAAVSTTEFESLGIRPTDAYGTEPIRGGDDDDLRNYNWYTYVRWALLGKDGKLATNWKDIAQIAVSVEHPEYIIDGETTGTFTIYGRDRNNVAEPIINKLVVDIKKVMPTAAPAGAAIQWRAQLGPDPIKLYVDPFKSKNENGYANWWTVNNNENMKADYGYYSLAENATFRLANNLSTHTTTVYNKNTYNADGILYEFQIADATANGKAVVVPETAYCVESGSNEALGDSWDVTYNRNGIRTFKTLARAYDLEIASDKVDNANHASAIYAYYPSLSLTVGDGNALLRANYKPSTPVQTFNSTVIDLLKDMNYASKSYKYKDKDGKDATDTYYYFNYDDVTGTTRLTQLLKQTDWAGTPKAATYGSPVTDLTSLIEAAAKARNTEILGFWATENNNTYATSLAAFDLTKFTPSLYYDVKVTLSGDIATYFEIKATSGIDLTNINTLNICRKTGLSPEINVDGSIVITGKDVFGKSVSNTISIKCLK